MSCAHHVFLVEQYGDEKVRVPSLLANKQARLRVRPVKEKLKSQARQEIDDQKHDTAWVY